MTAETPTPEADAEALQEQPAPACVMSFNASDPSGAGGIAGDVATIAAMGAHALPVVTSIVHARHRRGLRPPPDRRRRHRRAGPQRPRGRDHRGLEGRLPRLDRRRQRGRRDPVRLPRRAAGGLHAEPVVGRGRRAAGLPRRLPRAGAAADRGAGRQPPDADRLPAARLGGRAPGIAARARGGRRQARHALSCSSPASPLPDQFLDNVLASPQGAITGEKFERFEVSFVGAGDTLVGRAGRPARDRRRAACGRRRGARLPRPGARRGLSPRHGQRHPRPLLLGLAAADEDEEAAEAPPRPPTSAGAAKSPRHVH